MGQEGGNIWIDRKGGSNRWTKIRIEEFPSFCRMYL